MALVLIVDDSPTEQHIIANTLEKHGFEILCTDLSPEMIRACRDKGLTARVMDVTDLRLPPDSFDAAIAYLVLGWLIIQVADIVFDQLHLPAWAGTFVTALVIAGFAVKEGREAWENTEAGDNTDNEESPGH